MKSQYLLLLPILLCTSCVETELAEFPFLTTQLSCEFTDEGPSYVITLEPQNNIEIKEVALITSYDHNPEVHYQTDDQTYVFPSVSGQTYQYLLNRPNFNQGDTFRSYGRVTTEIGVFYTDTITLAAPVDKMPNIESAVFTLSSGPFARGTLDLYGKHLPLDKDKFSLQSDDFDPYFVSINPIDATHMQITSISPNRFGQLEASLVIDGRSFPFRFNCQGIDIQQVTPLHTLYGTALQVTLTGVEGNAPAQRYKFSDALTLGWTGNVCTILPCPDDRRSGFEFTVCVTDTELDIVCRNQPVVTLDPDNTWSIVGSGSSLNDYCRLGDIVYCAQGRGVLPFSLTTGKLGDKLTFTGNATSDAEVRQLATDGERYLYALYGSKSDQQSYINRLDVTTGQWEELLQLSQSPELFTFWYEGNGILRLHDSKDVQNYTFDQNLGTWEQYTPLLPRFQPSSGGQIGNYYYYVSEQHVCRYPLGNPRDTEVVCTPIIPIYNVYGVSEGKLYYCNEAGFNSKFWTFILAMSLEGASDATVPEAVGIPQCFEDNSIEGRLFSTDSYYYYLSTQNTFTRFYRKARL